ncbi:GATA type zinc finger protein asd-4-like [Trichoplusia ni]|uniref:GATA type zinc finger protein asd-4-like n=1 Tax=Trichoplusia ni TaxID=7111 RepID=A0A7E5X034_TRINI|nr:GATA type zinc finger protein asd-4-like [Trichoplusia ni]
MENLNTKNDVKVGVEEEVERRRTTRSSIRQSVEQDVVARSPRVVLERIASPQQQEDMEVAEQTYLSCRSRDSSAGRSDRKRPRRDISDDRLSVGAASDCGSEVSFASSTRSRGCVTHGRYVGLHRQREEFRRLAAESAQPFDTDQAKKDEEERQKRDARAAVRDMLSSGLKPIDPSSAKEMIEGGLMAVLEVARTSKNIKGCLIKKMKDAVEDIQGGVRALTKSAGTESLLAENARLSRELEELRAKVQSVEKRTAPAAQDEEDERMKRIMLSVGTMMDARLAGVISRLPPEPIMRPPLAADRRRAEAEAASRGPKPGYNQVLKAAPAPKQAPKPAPRQAPKPTPKPDPKPAKGKAKKSTGQPAPALTPATEEAPALAPAPQEPVPSTSETVEEGWTTVSNKKKKGPKPKAPEQPAAKPAKRTPPTKKQEGRKPATKGPKKESGRTRRRRGQRQRRLARTSAVVLTISEEGAQKALTYETVLREARETIDLKKMGVDMEVDPIRIRRTQTGARVLELPQNVGREAADGMAEELRARYGGDVRVTRPVRCAELRVSNLDDSVTVQEILDVAARQSQCAPDQLKVGDLRPSYGGNFSGAEVPTGGGIKVSYHQDTKVLGGMELGAGRAA